MWAQHRGHMP